MADPDETAVTRLARAIHYGRDKFGFVILETEDAETIAKLIADLCPNHQACETCGTALCDTCKVGDRSYCTHGRILCEEDQFPGCRDCVLDARDDDVEEAYIDGGLE